MNIWYSWRTKKVGEKFEFIVTKNVNREEPNEKGSYVDTTIEQRGFFKSRAIAKNRGQKWVRYLTQQQKKAA